MKILVIDGMGGGIGKAVVGQIKGALPACEITAVGTNSAATSAMLKAGADYSATGENAVAYNCVKADLIIGPLGIAFANSMHGEISEKMALAVTSADAEKLLLPVSKCNATILGVRDAAVGHLLAEMVELIRRMLGEQGAGE